MWVIRCDTRNSDAPSADSDLETHFLFRKRILASLISELEREALVEGFRLGSGCTIMGRSWFISYGCEHGAGRTSQGYSD